MEPQFDDELRQLKQALRQETFRFIIVGHNRYSLYQDIGGWLRAEFPERSFLELRFADKDYRKINDEIVAFKKGIVFIPDFGWLFRKANEAVCVAFNQRRDAFARLDIALICFIEPSEFIELSKKVPDWWSLRSLELDFHRETLDAGGEFLNSEYESYSLGGQTKEEKEAEIQRLLRQIEATEPTNKILLASFYNQIGNLYFALSSISEAQKYFEERLLLCHEISDYQGEGEALNSLSRVASVRGNYDLALSYLERSLEIRQLIGDKRGESQSLNNISQIYGDKGDHTTALDYLEQSLKITRSINERLGEGVILNNISQIYKEQGKYEKAIDYLQQSLKIRKQIKDRSGESTTLVNLGGIEFAFGNYSSALSYLQESLKINEQIGDRITEGSTLNNIGFIYKILNNYDLALEYLQKSLIIREQIGDRLGIGMTSNNLGELYFVYLQNTEKAVPLFLQAYIIFQQIGTPQAETSESYLNDILKQIGEEKFNKIVQSAQNDLQF